MGLISTNEAAEAMLSSGGYFSAQTLGKKLGISAKEASGLLYNIRMSKKYETIETLLPNRTIKVMDIEGRKKTNNLWCLALGIKPK